MIKKLVSMGLGIAIVLLASSAIADLKFWGGDMNGTTNIEPTQHLMIDSLTGVQTGIQKLASGNKISFTTTPMSALVGDNQFLTRSISGTIGKTITDRQVTGASHAKTGISAGLQETMASFTVASSDMANLLGNGGNIRFDSERGANPSITFNIFEQETLHDIPTNGTSMRQRDNYTAGITSPGVDAEDPLTFIAIGGGNGIFGFASSIGGKTLRQQSFDATLWGGLGTYKGFQQDAGLLKIESLTTVGTVAPTPAKTQLYY